jgi:hypothetical protein
MRRSSLGLLTQVLALGIAVGGCAARTTGPSIVRFEEYAVAGQASATQSKSLITITLEMLRPTDLYKYPEYFSFDVARLLESETLKARCVSSRYPIGPQRLSWDYILADPPGARLLVGARVRIANGTGHILRMRDARVYLLVPGSEPQAAMSDFQELRSLVTSFEEDFAARLERPLVNLSGCPPYPTGLYPAILDQNRRNYRLINEVAREILPGFALEGLLVFPTFVGADSITVSFFDITIRTNAAGDPIEKTRFDFPFGVRQAQMWYDPAERRWKPGGPLTSPR